MADFFDVLFRPAVGFLFYGIHADENVGTCEVLCREPLLKLIIRDGFCGQNTLHGLLTVRLRTNTTRLINRVGEAQEHVRRQIGIWG